MSLSSELISQFVKITNDSNDSVEETTVYGTIVEYEGTNYVRLDGSELLTPITTAANVKPGERVTVMIKNHTATVTGNLSSPSARIDDLDGLDDVASIISEFEIVLAQKVDTDDLVAEQARIDELIAKGVEITGTLEAAEADIDILQANHLSVVERLEAAEADIENLVVGTLDVTTLDAKYAKIGDLEATNADVYNLESTYANFEVANANRFAAVNATIADLNAAKLSADDADIKYAKIADLDATNGNITNLEADIADIDTLIFGSATGNTIHSSFANSVIAQLGDAQIKSAMIENVSADKINAGTISTNQVRIKSDDGLMYISDETIRITDGSRMRVQIGKDASNDYSINIWDVNGNLMFSKGGITSNAIKNAIIRDDMVSDMANISAYKLDINSLFKAINDSTKTIKSSRIYLDDKAQTLDVVFKEIENEISDIGETVSSQGTQLSVVQGKIDSKVWQQDINTAVESVGSDVSELNTQYSELSQEINSVSATIANHTTQISKKADASTVTDVREQISKVETDLGGFRSTVNSTYATKTELSTAQSELSSTIELREDSILSSVSNTYATKTALNTTNSNVTAAKNAADAAQADIDDLVIGGRNLFSGYDDSEIQLNDYQGVGGFTQFHNRLTFNPCETVGETYTISFWAKSPNGPTPITVYNQNGQPRHFYFGRASFPNQLTDEWQYFTHTVTNTDRGETYDDSVCNRIEIYASGQLGVLVKKIKVERGTRATDWTPAPEDMATAEEVATVQKDIEAADERISTTESLIQQLTDSITMLVTDSNGESLMVQTESGWTFSTAQIQDTINSTSESLNDLTHELGDIDTIVTTLSQAVADLGVLNDYVKIGTYENEPCIELGESDSEFKMRITNTRILFMEGSNVVAHISNQSLHIKKAVIEEELQQGEFVWQIRSNGNLGLIWKG